MHTPLPIVPLPAGAAPAAPAKPKRPYIVAYRLGGERHEVAVQAEDTIDALLSACADHGLHAAAARLATGTPALQLAQA